MDCDILGLPEREIHMHPPSPGILRKLKTGELSRLSWRLAADAMELGEKRSSQPNPIGSMSSSVYIPSAAMPAAFKQNQMKDSQDAARHQAHIAVGWSPNTTWPCRPIPVAAFQGKSVPCISNRSARLLLMPVIASSTTKGRYSLLKEGNEIEKHCSSTQNLEKIFLLWLSVLKKSYHSWISEKEIC